MNKEFGRFWEHIEKNFLAKEANDFLTEQFAREDAQLGLMLTEKGRAC